MNENEIHDSADTWRIDLMIDQVIAADGPPAAASADEALLSELAGLDPMEWPADDSGDRIARMVASRTGLPRRGQSGDRASSSRPRARVLADRRSRWIAAGAAAAVALVLAIVAVQLAPWRSGPSGGTAAKDRGISASPSSPSSGPATSTPPTPLGTGMRLLPSDRSFQEVADAAGNSGDFLLCVTTAICYSTGATQNGNKDYFERSADGGVTWHRQAQWPLGGNEAYLPSCPTASTCAAITAAGLAWTTDGFAHVRTVPVTRPAGIGMQGSSVSCATVASCVVTLSTGGGNPLIVYTVNGGQTWANASVPAVNGAVYKVNCDKNGQCVALAVGGTEPTRTYLTLLMSADGGRSWTASRSYPEPSAQQIATGCGAGPQCTLMLNTGYLIRAVATAAGNVTVTRQPLPGAGLQGEGNAISCPTVRDCFVAADNPSQAYIEATHDGGRTWRSIALPWVGPSQDPVGSTSLLSCPSRAGCLALVDALHYGFSHLVLMSSLP